MGLSILDVPEVRHSEDLERDPALDIWLAFVLPFGYATWWFWTVAGELRDYGHDIGNDKLARVSAGRALLGMLVGWVLVVPAVVVIVGTARRVQQAESQERPIAGVIAVVVASQAAAFACVLAGWAILVPVALLVSAAVVMRLLQPRLNALWEAADALPVRPDDEWESVPLVPEGISRWWSSRQRGDLWEGLRFFAGLGACGLAVYGVVVLANYLAAEDRTGLLTGFVTAIAVVGLLVGTSLLAGSAMRQLVDGRWMPGQLDGVVAFTALLSTVTAVAALWAIRPAFHGVVMALYQWPLATWIPLVLGLLFAVAFAAGGRERTGIVWRPTATFVMWFAFMVALPGWQGHALYAASVYTSTDLPRKTQPRLLPKVAALAFASDASLHDAHLVVDPSSNRLVWSAEQATGTLRRGPSQGVIDLALDDVTGKSDVVARGFHPAVSRIGPGSLQWRAYDRDYLTRVEDAVVVPGAGGEAVAVAPYLRYTGFPVRHPVWAGVYVYHQDGRMETLTPQQALARPELAASGRLYPERLARAVATAYGVKVDDPSGNPQPYLTNLGDREVSWVTVAHDTSDESDTSAVFLTDGATGATDVWTPSHGTRLLSNQGAVAVVKQLALQWDTTDENGDIIWMRKAVEPTPVFANGRLYYLVSIVANPEFVDTTYPVEETVVVDAANRRIVKEYNDDEPGASEALMAFFNPSR